MKKLIPMITAAVFLPATSALASDPVFDDPVYYASGLNPQAVCSGDFNEDGHLDLAASARSSDRVYVFVGSGDGSFSPGVDYNAGNSPFHICTCDLNEDGHLDLAVANYESNYVSILLGAGDGTFIYASSHVTDSGPCHIDTEDFNEDGHTDLAVVNWTQVPGSGTLSIMLGSGDGGFFSNNIEYTAIGMRNVAAADFDEDGHVDLAIMSREAQNISILIGAGDGTFTELTRYDPGAEPTIPVTYDFNGDGHVDFAVGNFGSDNVSVLIGNGDGTFPSINNYPGGDGPWTIDLADFNRDGNIDIATANRYGDDVSVLTGNGDGTFGSPFNFNVGDDPQGVCAGDFNEDGFPDLATAHNESNDIAVLINLTPADITFDIKPRSCPNPFNINWFKNIDKGNGNVKGKHKKGGLMPAAIVGSEHFDVTDIDPTSLLVEGIEPERHSYEDVATLETNQEECACNTDGPDGIMDLSLKISSLQLASVLGDVEGGDVITLTITGEMLDGTPFELSDCVTILSREPEEPSFLDRDQVVLYPAIPNPFNPVTRIRYALPEESFVKLTVFDVSGRVVGQLVSGRQSAGEHVIEWDAGPRPSGLYFSRLEVGDFVETRKLILLK
jgi:hypothetical protein